LPREPDVLEIDVTSPEQLAAAGQALASRWDRLHGLLHAIGFAPPDCLGSGMFAAGWDDVSAALNVSAYSLKALLDVFMPLLSAAGKDGGASVVALDFDATVAWPVYDWMGVAKAALESLSRYLAKELGPRGIRVNLVAAGPVRTMAAKSIPGFSAFEDTWAKRAPLGWDVHDGSAVAKACVALFSDLFPMTTGEIVHVDGGVHAVGGSA
jgi:meromycolic acid enoyl-[acyl-carrier-protein] reductase